MTEQTEKLSKIQTALGEDSETSLLTQIQKLIKKLHPSAR